MLLFFLNWDKLICFDIENDIVVGFCFYFLIGLWVIINFVLFEVLFVLVLVGNLIVLIVFVVVVWWLGVFICLKLLFFDDFELIKNCVDIIILFFGSKFLMILKCVLLFCFSVICIDLKLLLLLLSIIFVFLVVWIMVLWGISNVVLCWVGFILMWVNILGFNVWLLLFSGMCIFRVCVVFDKDG